MKRNELQSILRNHIEENCGSYDSILIRNNYGISYNDKIIGYVCIYVIVESDKEEKGYYIDEAFYQGYYEVEEVFGKRFFDSCDEVKLRKAKKYIENYFIC